MIAITTTINKILVTVAAPLLAADSLYSEIVDNLFLICFLGAAFI